MPETAAAPALPVIYQTTIGAEWVDFNGHLRDGYYMVLFSSAVDALMDLAGLNDAGRKATGHSWFTLEAHVNYLHEVKQGAAGARAGRRGSAKPRVRQTPSARHRAWWRARRQAQCAWAGAI